MQAIMVFLRLVHITLGVFWAGAIFFIVIFLEPSVRAAGPDGAAVMRGLKERQLLNVLPLIAGLTILSGIALYWYVSGGLTPGWMTSPYGLSLTVGGVASILAFAIGFFIMRRASLRVFSLGATLTDISDEAVREGTMTEMDALRVRARTSARWVAMLLLIAVAAMAVARYI